MIAGVMFDFGLTLAYPPSFDDVVRSVGHRLGHADDYIDAFIASIYSVENHPAVLAAESRRDHSCDEHRAADMSYAIASGADLELMTAFYDQCLEPDLYALYPDAHGVLAALREAGVRVALLSNCGWDLRRNLHHLGIGSMFDAVTLSCEEGMVKPDPALFALACARLGLALVAKSVRALV